MASRLANSANTLPLLYQKLFFSKVNQFYLEDQHLRQKMRQTASRKRTGKKNNNKKQPNNVLGRRLHLRLRLRHHNLHNHQHLVIVSNDFQISKNFFFSFLNWKNESKVDFVFSGVGTQEKQRTATEWALIIQANEPILAGLGFARFVGRLLVHVKIKTINRASPFPFWATIQKLLASIMKIISIHINISSTSSALVFIFFAHFFHNDFSLLAN